MKRKIENLCNSEAILRKINIENDFCEFLTILEYYEEAIEKSIQNIAKCPKFAHIYEVKCIVTILKIKLKKEENCV